MELQTILISNEDLTRNTIIGGNVDVDRYLSSVKQCQNIYVKPLLGVTLYNKIVSDYENSTLTGLYLTLYNDYVCHLVIHGGAEIYLQNAAYLVSNAGISKIKTDTSETISKEEIDYLVQSSRKLYNLYETEFLKWIKENELPEYVKTCGNAGKTYGGWYLSKKRRH